MTPEPHKGGIFNSVRFRLSLGLIAVSAVGTSTVMNGLINNLGDCITNGSPILVEAATLQGRVLNV